MEAHLVDGTNTKICVCGTTVTLFWRWQAGNTPIILEVPVPDRDIDCCHGRIWFTKPNFLEGIDVEHQVRIDFPGGDYMTFPVGLI